MSARWLLLLLAWALSAQAYEPSAEELAEEAAYRAEMLAKERAWIEELLLELRKATEFELMALTGEGYSPESSSCFGFCFQTWQVRGSVPIRAPFEIEAVRTELRRWLDGPEPNTIKLCFYPHHGIRMRVDEEVIDFAICYECEQLHVYRNFGRGFRGVSFKADRHALDRLLIAHGVEPTGLERRR